MTSFCTLKSCQVVSAQTNIAHNKCVFGSHTTLKCLPASRKDSSRLQLVRSWFCGGNIPVNRLPKPNDPKRSAISLKVPPVNPRWDFPLWAEVELLDARWGASSSSSSSLLLPFSSFLVLSLPLSLSSCHSPRTRISAIVQLPSSFPLATPPPLCVPTSPSVLHNFFQCYTMSLRPRRVVLSDHCLGHKALKNYPDYSVMQKLLQYKEAKELLFFKIIYHLIIFL